MDVLKYPGGVVMSGLMLKKGDKKLINADSIRKAEVDYTFATKQEMYDFIWNDILNPQPAETNDLFE